MRRSHLVLSAVLASVCLGGGSAAYADLASGTPLFACTAPTLNTDGSAIPATGSLSIASFRFYLDGGTTPAKTATGVCTWQTLAGDISAGSHTAQATAVNVAGAESARTTALPFVVPAPKPATPTGLTVQ